MTTPSSDAPTAFDIHPEAAGQAIRELRTARAELWSIRNDARALAEIDPGSRDQVSRDAAVVLGRAADGGPGSFIAAADEGLVRIDELLAALQGSIDRYRSSDDETASSLG